MIYIGIVSRVEKDQDNFNITGIGEYYRKALLKYADVTPILILPPKDIVYGETSHSEEKQIMAEDNNKLNSLLDLCDAFIVPGGTRWFSYDEYIIKYAIEKDKPLLGICLGMQIMAVLDNEINTNLEFRPNKIESLINHQQPGVDYIHEIKIREDSLLYKILETDKCLVNSRHTYCINKVNKFVVSAYSEDGIIEAIELPGKRFVLGVQWHPELMIEYNDRMKKIFDYFIKEASNKEESFNIRIVS